MRDIFITHTPAVLLFIHFTALIFAMAGGLVLPLVTAMLPPSPALEQVSARLRTRGKGTFLALLASGFALAITRYGVDFYLNLGPWFTVKLVCATLLTALIFLNNINGKPTIPYGISIMIGRGLSFAAIACAVATFA